MMQKVKAFFHVFVNSLIPQAAYYHKILQARLSFSFKYFLSLVIVLNLLLSLFYALKLNPLKINMGLTNLINSLEKFPAELTIDIKNSQLTTNHNRPYFLWFDYQDTKHLLLVIDETAAPQKIKEYNSYILVTGNDIVLKDKNKNLGYSLVNLSVLKDQIITKQTVNEVESSLVKIRQLLILAYPAAFAIFFTFFLLSSLFTTTLYILIASGLTFVLYKLFLYKKASPKLTKTFQISLHSITLPLFLNYLYGAFNLRSFYQPILFLLLFIIFTAVGLYEGYTHQPHRPTKLRRKK